MIMPVCVYTHGTCVTISLRTKMTIFFPTIPQVNRQKLGFAKFHLRNETNIVILLL